MATDEVVVGVHQPGVRGDDAVPVAVGVVARRDVELVAPLDERGHRRRGRAVHPDPAVPVERHEPPGGVHERVDDGEVEAVPLGDGAPVVDGRTAQRVGADPDPRRPDGVDVEDAREVVDVGAEEVVGLHRGAGPGERHPLHPVEPRADVGVGGRGDDLRRVGVGRAAVRRVVLEATVRGRVVRGRDDDAVREPAPGRHVGDAGDLPAVRHEDGVRHRRRRRVAVGGVDEHGDVVGDEHLERARPRRLGEAVGVAADEQWSVVALLAAVVADRLGRGEDVCLVERGLQARPAVPGRPEGHLLVEVLRIGLARVVGGDQRRDVDEVGGLGGLSGARGGHALDPRRGRGRRYRRSVPRITPRYAPRGTGETTTWCSNEV